jgi:hypothetical protein
MSCYISENTHLGPKIRDKSELFNLSHERADSLDLIAPLMIGANKRYIGRRWSTQGHLLRLKRIIRMMRMKY